MVGLAVATPEKIENARGRHSALERLAELHGATRPTLDLLSLARERPLRPPLGPSSEEILAELRADRI